MIYEKPQNREPAVYFPTSEEYFDFILENNIHNGFTMKQRIWIAMNCPQSLTRIQALHVSINRLAYEAGRVKDLECKYLLRMLGKILRMELQELKESINSLKYASGDWVAITNAE